MPPKSRTGQGARKRKLEKLKRRVADHKAARRNAQSNDSTTNHSAVPTASASTSSQAPAFSTINGGLLSTGSISTYPTGTSAHPPAISTSSQALAFSTTNSGLLSACSIPTYPTAIPAHPPRSSALNPTTSISSLLSASLAPPPAISGHKPIVFISEEDHLESSYPSPRPQPESCHGHFDSVYFQSGLEPLDEASDELDELHVPHRPRPPSSKSSVDRSGDKRDSAMDTDNEAINELDGISVLLVGRRGVFRLLTSR